MSKYKIITGEPSEVEEILNHLEEKYDIKIISMSVNSPSTNIQHREITILIKEI
ncbi:MAG: hypothetical protein GY845_03095 [Planctomycetes bacterium]|nr:hypothetical protein [Planctomycetota bacterium]